MLDRKRWSPEEDAVLSRLHGEAIIDKEIAYRLGRTPDSVRFRRRRLGLVKKPQLEGCVASIYLWLNPEMFNQLRQQASQHGMRTTTYARRLLGAQLGIEEAA